MLHAQNGMLHDAIQEHLQSSFPGLDHDGVFFRFALKFSIVHYNHGKWTKDLLMLDKLMRCFSGMGGITTYGYKRNKIFRMDSNSE